MPPFLFRGVVATLAVFAFTACHDPGAAYERRSVSSAEALARVQRNPAPVQAHRLLVTVEGAPGAFAHAEATAHYQGVDSYGCRYPTTGLGTWSVPKPSLPVPVTRLPDGRFELTVYDDAFLATDLFGTGVCDWMTLGPTVVLKASDDKPATNFVMHVQGSGFRAQRPSTRYFSVLDYQRPRPSGVSISGVLDRERFDAEAQDELFTITVTFDEAKP